MKNYNLYVKEYQGNPKEWCCNLEYVHKKMSTCKDMCDAIKKATRSRFDARKHPHQKRIPNDVLENFLLEIKRYSRKLNNLTYFHDIFELISCIGSQIKGIGKLTNYDVSLRIAFYLYHKTEVESVLPTKVYLHSGALVGAKRILNKIPQSKIVEVNAFPKAIQKLKPYEIEDFLCVYKDKF